MRENATIGMGGRFAVRLVMAFVCACALAGGLAAQEVKAPEDLHPPGTMFFLSVKNPQGSAAFRDSALYKIAREPEMKAFVEHVEDTCRAPTRKIARSTRRPLSMSRIWPVTTLGAAGSIRAVEVVCAPLGVPVFGVGPD